MQTEEQIFLQNVFLGNYIARRDEARKNDLSFVHYTTAENALRILKTKEFWLRRASIMNDYSEIQYGENCIAYAINIHQIKINQILNDIRPDLAKKIGNLIDEQLVEAKQHTFIGSFAEHDSNEKSHDNQFGRLSMWRAYGGSAGAAMVLRRESFFNEGSQSSGVFISPVHYCTVEQFAPEFLKMFEKVEANKDKLKEMDEPQLIALFSFSLLYAILSTKHRGFEEEKEWRLIYSTPISQSKHVQITNETIQGVPQRVCRFPLKNSRSLGINKVEIPELLERLIVGPCKFPMDIYDAFVSQLAEADVPEAYKKVHCSFIPIRT